MDINCNKCNRLLPLDQFTINLNNRTIAGRCNECKSKQYDYPYRDKKAKGTAKKAGRPPKIQKFAINVPHIEYLS